MKIKIKKQLKCKRCGHEWNPRTDEVFSCPKCHSPKWNLGKNEARRL
jgi:Zn finger protein HypA/HybF involved in hydrogenase expression